MFDWIATPEGWIALATLFALEVVLGIDNIVFLSILVGRLPPEQRELARKLGLGLALVARLALLFSITWVMGLVDPWFTAFGEEISGRDVILIGGGLFLLAKSTHEIHNSLEGVEEGGSHVIPSSFGMALVQIAVLDIVFSLDSVITAVGMVGEISLMAVAIVLAVIVMLFARAIAPQQEISRACESRQRKAADGPGEIAVIAVDTADWSCRLPPNSSKEVRRLADALCE